jgi:hypothetical protein
MRVATTRTTWMTNSYEDEVARGTRFDDDLFERILRSVEPGEDIETLSRRETNQIVAIDRAGLLVATARSKDRGTGPHMVPAWMILRAWRHLCRHGSLSLPGLTEGLRVNRSSFVFALLSRFPEVEVESVRPTRLRLIDRSETTELKKPR